MIVGIAYGRDDKGWYVQQVCGEMHLGQECDCKIIKEKLTEVKAKKLAKELSEKNNVEILAWG